MCANDRRNVGYLIRSDYKQHLLNCRHRWNKMSSRNRREWSRRWQRLYGKRVCVNCCRRYTAAFLQGTLANYLLLFFAIHRTCWTVWWCKYIQPVAPAIFSLSLNTSTFGNGQGWKEKKESNQLKTLDFFASITKRRYG